MSEIISIANQKGGVGKTTTAVNLASSLADNGKKVLLIDLDSQSNATISLGFNKNDYEFNIYHAFLGIKKLKDIILKTDIKRLSLAPSNIGLAGIAKELYNPKNSKPELILREKIKSIDKKYDYIILDLPSVLGLVSINGLSASDAVIIPIQCEFFALEGLAQLTDTVNLLKQTINPKLKIKGYLPTMYTTQNNLSKQVLDDLTHHFKDKLFYPQDKKKCIVIPRNIKIAEAPSFGKPVTKYASNSKGSIAYQELALAILRR